MQKNIYRELTKTDENFLKYRNKKKVKTKKHHENQRFSWCTPYTVLNAYNTLSQSQSENTINKSLLSALCSVNGVNRTVLSWQKLLNMLKLAVRRRKG